MGGLPKVGSKDAGAQRAPTSQRAKPVDEAFGALDFDAMGLAADTSTRRKVVSRAKARDDKTLIAGLGALADAIAQTRDPSSPPPSSRAGGVRSVSDVVPRHDADAVSAMRELYARGDAEAALAIASELAPELPTPDAFGDVEILVEDDDSECTAITASPDSRRLAAFTSQKVPRLLVAPQEIPRLPIDPRAAFIVGHVDGIQSMGDILDICAMPESEALEVFTRLQALGVISLD